MALGRAKLPRHYALLAELARDDDVIFVANPGLLAARVVQEKFGRPLATPLLQPGMIQSSSAPPAHAGGADAAPLGAAAGGSMSTGACWTPSDRFCWAGSLNDLRGPLGLPPVKRFFRWWLSPQLVLGMFPDWYAPPQPDWPPQIRLTGFPRYDGGAAQRPLEEKLRAFCGWAKRRSRSRSARG